MAPFSTDPRDRSRGLPAKGRKVFRPGNSLSGGVKFFYSHDVGERFDRWIYSDGHPTGGNEIARKSWNDFTYTVIAVVLFLRAFLLARREASFENFANRFDEDHRIISRLLVAPVVYIFRTRIKRGVRRGFRNRIQIVGSELS